MEMYSSSPGRFIEDYFFKELENEMGVSWLIERIFSRGTHKDIKAIRKYYGDERIKKEAVQIHWLDKETLSLFSTIYEIPKQEFLTYRLLFPINTNKQIL